ncbi:hypothetical protein VTO73DRAFT_3406 [Trametes versicolor]
MLEEQLAIFLYTCRTGLSTRHVGERFQRANATITKYFKKMLIALSSPPFYTSYVRLPEETEPVPERIYYDPRYHPFFEHVLGAGDGSHITTAPSAEERGASRNRKGGVSQNIFATCTLDTLLFTYVLSGIEGSATDSTVFQRAREADFRVPEGRYYLADAGYGFNDALLVPYRGVRYHLAEWGRAAVKPVNKEELFNLRHAKLRNAIERIFGIVKKRFPILRSGLPGSLREGQLQGRSVNVRIHGETI